ncbi:hypothetical protein [Thermococcus guaymasensis]|uniref:hypothetical protein n=1 Tax=Thermococcus guaymasensis TaxID=110164 RepID=UPI001FE05EED|nr:hypothetical protein [Thermococcus guaymasensis]
MKIKVVLCMGLFEELINEALELINAGDTKKAVEVLLTAWAYQESGMLMSPPEALRYLMIRFPEVEELASIQEEGENLNTIARKISARLGMKSLPSAER